MTFKQVELHEEALAEAQAAYDWYLVRNTAAAEGFIAELDQAIEQIGAFPDASGAHISGTRRHVMRRFPFIVIYREQQQVIQVIAVAHGRRRPGYWKHRA